MNSDSDISLVVHMIANAHLDPAWLWTWQRGSDEALATCRAVCDIMDEDPEPTFTRGDAWAYEQIRVRDPELFGRILGHVKSGRWEVTGGWWVQPDVNLPSEEAILRSAALGKRWFRRWMGVKQIPVAYNVDSFGHGAYLPRFIRKSGQKYYVMMRPQEFEKTLPSSLFRWQSPDGFEVLTFRIIGGYCHGGADLARHVENAVAGAPRGVGHVMCFYGVGNHGGGPTRAAIAWIKNHRNFAPGVELRFSTVLAFFRAVEKHRRRLPIVVGELQMHAVGCYSVCAELKRGICRAELAATECENLLSAVPPASRRPYASVLDGIWEKICFNQFHDIMGGTCIPDATEAAIREVSSAETNAEKTIHLLLRRHPPKCVSAGPEGHRLHFVNVIDRPWKGLVEYEVWMDWRPWRHRLVDAAGTLVPCQIVPPASLVMEPGLTQIPRLLVPMSLGAMEHRILGIVPDDANADAAKLQVAATLDNGCFSNGAVAVRFGRPGVMEVADVSAGASASRAEIDFACLDDNSDTWSHGLSRYDGPARAGACFSDPILIEAGSLRSTVALNGTLGRSRISVLASLEPGRRILWFTAKILSVEPLSIVKLRIRLPGSIWSARHLVAGGWIERPLDGLEYPIHHALRAETTSGAIGLILPDSFAVDVSQREIRPTLLRNSIHAYHSSNRLLQATPASFGSTPETAGRFGTDDGPHRIRMAVAFGNDATEEGLLSELDRFHHPPRVWDDFLKISRLARCEPAAE